MVCWGGGASEFRETAGECSDQGRPWGKLTFEKSLKGQKKLGKAGSLSWGGEESGGGQAGCRAKPGQREQVAG